MCAQSDKGILFIWQSFLSKKVESSDFHPIYSVLSWILFNYSMAISKYEFTKYPISETFLGSSSFPTDQSNNLAIGYVMG